jgi:hypothetical protein
MTYTAFVGDSVIASGSLAEIFPILKKSFERDPGALILTFTDQTGEQVDFDLRKAVPAASSEEPRVGPGRPKLGVVSREISLLPRHWEWLQEQSGGASAAIRRLIDEERKRDPEKFGRLMATKAAGRFMSALAGNLPGYEEASRALYGGDSVRFRELIALWPVDVRDYASRLAAIP